MNFFRYTWNSSTSQRLKQKPDFPKNPFPHNETSDTESDEFEDSNDETEI